MSKITLKCKKYKRKCIDKALSVYLEKAGYIFDSSSVEKVFNKLGLAQLGFTRIHSAQQALYNIVAEDKILPYSPSSLGEIYRSVFSNVTSPVSLSLCTILDADDSLTFIFRASTPRRTEPDCGQLRQIISR